MSSDRRSGRRERRGSQAVFTAADRRRLAGLVVLLVLVLVVFVEMVRRTSQSPPPARGSEPEIPSHVALPPMDLQELDAVRDGTAAERVILEPEAYRSLAKAAQLLLPSHFRYLGEPRLPFDDLERSAPSLRGRPFRHRGEVLQTEPIVRSPGAPPEFWTWLRTDDGHDLIFVALNQGDDLFGSQNFVLADGLFFKIYTWSVRGERVTAPLLVGRNLIPSYRKLSPAREPDFKVLGRVRDHEITEELELDFDALWQLLNVAHTLAAEPAAMDAAFEGAPELDRHAMESFFHDPQFRNSQRGRPWRIFCRVMDSWSTEAGENPLRIEWITRAFAGNTNWGMPVVEVVAPGRLPLPTRADRENYRVLLGWFLQMDAYETAEGSRRRTPVFVLGDARVPPAPATPAWVLGLMGGFAVLALALTAFLVVMIRRDRAQAARAQATLEKIRRRARERKPE